MVDPNPDPGGTEVNKHVYMVNRWLFTLTKYTGTVHWSVPPDGLLASYLTLQRRLLFICNCSILMKLDAKCIDIIQLEWDW